MSGDSFGDGGWSRPLLGKIVIPGPNLNSAEVYVDKTGTAEKPDPLRDVYLEFPRAMLAVAEVTAYGAGKHSPRGWQTFEPEYGMNYHRSKVGRHLLKEELDGPVNHEDGGLLHAAQTVWNMLAYLENYLKLQEEGKGLTEENKPGTL